MGKIKNTRSGWAPVHLNAAVLASGVEGLVGIEELTDYELVNNEIKCLNKGSKHSVDIGLGKEKLTSQTNRLSSLELGQVGKRGFVKKELGLRPNVIKTSGLEHKNGLKPSSPPDFGVNNEINNESDDFELFPWTNLFAPVPVAKALIEKGFKEPTEIQVSRLRYA